MLYFENKDKEYQDLVTDWKNNKLTKEQLLGNESEHLSVFSMLSECGKESPSTLSDVYQICVSLGKIDASLAWIIGVSNSAWSMLGNMPKDTVNQINYPVLSMVLGRPGKVRFNKKDNTAVITGTWKYCSGFEQANGFLGLVKDESVDGEVYVALMPTKNLKVLEPWNAIGLKGTNSHTIQADKLTVDTNSLIPYSTILNGSIDVSDLPSYRNLFTGVLMNCLTGSIVGATLHLLDLAIEKNCAEPINGSNYTFGKDSGAIRTYIGDLTARMEEIYEFGANSAAFVDKVANGDEEIWTTQNRARLRARASSVMKQCREVADELLWLMGSSVLTEDNPTATLWKDIQIGTLHGGFSRCIPQEALGISVFSEDPFELTKML
ncbi:hypothetical protein AB0O14_19080 [Microbacterium foliorum]|uniref:hypothetical protein n=1 Tax=Rothia terrae TaxID=396015 RepID=UPI00343D516F